MTEYLTRGDVVTIESRFEDKSRPAIVLTGFDDPMVGQQATVVGLSSNEWTHQATVQVRPGDISGSYSHSPGTVVMPWYVERVDVQRDVSSSGPIGEASAELLDRVSAAIASRLCKE